MAVITNDEEAHLASIANQKFVPEDADDPVRHIIIVESDAAGNRYANYGFHSYCVLDPETFEPTYVTYGNRRTRRKNVKSSEQNKREEAPSDE